MKRSLIVALAAVAMYAIPAHAVDVCPADGNARFSYDSESSPTGPEFFSRFGRFICDAPADAYDLGSMPSSSFEVFCIDFTGPLDPVAQYDVWLTEVSAAGVAASSNERLNPLADGFDRYWRAIWLINRYFVLGGTPGGNSAAYQWAIWGITDNTSAYDNFYAGAGALRLLALAENPAGDPNRFAEWRIITHVGELCNDAGFDPACKQELVYKSGSPPQEIVPEPATMSLLAMGLAGMAGAGIRRRKQK